MKTCTCCHETKPIEAFSWTQDKRLKVQKPQSWCKVCMTLKAKTWYAANKDRALAQQAAWRGANRAQWNSRMAVAGKKRYCAKLQRVPCWYDQAKVQEIYELAAEFREAGFDVDVDHIVPLQAVEASGLHWHGNLRVCLVSANRRRRNALSLPHEPLAAQA